MAAKNSTKAIQTQDQDLSTVLYDETFELRDGSKLRMVVDLATIMTKVQEYAEALYDARSLPFDLENLSARDKIVRYLVDKYGAEIKSGAMSEASIVTRARNYYLRAMSEAQTNAHLLAFFDSDENLFLNKPEPYEPQAPKAARFVDQMPEVVRNLAFPIEYTLKQILDLLIDNPVIMGRIMQISEELSVRVNRVVAAGGLVETDENGFQPGSTD